MPFGQSNLRASGGTLGPTAGQSITDFIIGVLGGAIGTQIPDFPSAPAFPELPANLPGGIPGLTAPSVGVCPSMFRSSSAAARPADVVMIPNPVTGKPTFFGHLGRPLLWSRDLRAAKKVTKLARRARRTRGGR